MANVLVVVAWDTVTNMANDHILMKKYFNAVHDRIDHNFVFIMIFFFSDAESPEGSTRCEPSPEKLHWQCSDEHHGETSRTAGDQTEEVKPTEHNLNIPSFCDNLRYHKPCTRDSISWCVEYDSAWAVRSYIAVIFCNFPSWKHPDVDALITPFN